MIINHNMSAINANRQMATNQANTAKSTQKLSSGLRINRAGDDAAGLVISEKMRAQISGLNRASSNAQDGISLVQTAEGALNETHSILQRMRELSVQSSTDTNTDADRKEIQKEVEQLTEEITRISTDTEFNTKALLNGSRSNGDVNTITKGVTAVTGTAPTATSTGTLGGLKIESKEKSDVLNGYKIQLGTVAQGTETSASISGNTITLNGDFSATPAAAKADVQKALNDALASKGINATFEVTGTAADTATGTNITFSGGTTEVLAVKGEYMSAVQVGKDVTIDGVTIAKDDFKDMETLAAAINANGTLNAKYEASENNGKLLLTQKTADETLADPVVRQEGNSLTFQIGANAGQTMSLSIADMSAQALGISKIDVSGIKGATDAIDTIDSAITKVSAQRASLGAVQNRLEHTINNLGTSSENLTSAESRIRDVDMASEMMEFTKNNVLSQASQAMLAQAKALPNQVLSLLQ